jgi:energy-converting hydrogenase A subunit M
MVTTQIPELVQQKLDAFERMQAEFEQCFHFKQEVHGQKRFSSFSIGQIVYYLHALWLCERKDRLLSVYAHSRRYEGERCLELLRTWQMGCSSEVIAFLLAKLDMSSFAQFTAQIEEARQRSADNILTRLLERGRLLQLNRGINLVHALETISALNEEDLLAEVSTACAQYSHTPAQIEAQLAETATPLCSFRPHAALAQRNMVLMNRVDANVFAQIAESSSAHFWDLKSPDRSEPAFAEQVISGYLPMLAPVYNNLRGVRFVDRPELTRD